MRAVIYRIQNGERWFAAELGLRLAGVALLAICAGATLWLYRAVHRLPLHTASGLELLAATAVVLGWCLGWPLLVEGPGLFRLVPLPGHWESIDL